jgi:hypothetical protein
LTVNSTAAGDNVGLTSNSVSVSGNSVFFTNIQNLTVNLLGAGDAVTMTGIIPTTPTMPTSTTVNAQTDTNHDSFGGNLPGDFPQYANLLLQHFTNTQMMVVGNFNGQWTVTGSGTIQDLTVGQSLGSSGMVMAEDITNISVMGNLAGQVTASSPSATDGNIGTVIVGGDFTGRITATGTLTTVSVTGATTGILVANFVSLVSAQNAVAGSPAMNVTSGGVTRKLIATRADNGLATPPSVKFKCLYEGTATGGPQITIQVTNGNPNVRFDLSLVSSTNAKFNLARLFANGTSDIRNVSIDGDLLATPLSPAALAYFGLPAGTTGGIFLPLDTLGAVAAEGNVVAGTVQVTSLQAVAFGSITANGFTTLAQNATHVDAAGLLAGASVTVPANDTYTVPFDDAQPVAFFLGTGPGTFDEKDVLFTDQVVDNHGITATVTASSEVISTVVLVGDGGSIQTSQPITASITSTGRLGDLTLSSSTGIGNVTAPSIFGNIDTQGPIFGTIQTTSGDIGRAITSGGTIVGTTIIDADHGISGRIISRGNLVSQITSQTDFSGVIAAQGDIGVANINATTHQLVSRFGGILSKGQFTGDVVALGNIVGDIEADGGFNGRITAKGHAVAGLLATQTGILGNIRVSGEIDAGSAIVSGGEIGDAASGTSLSSGAIEGIIAAERLINFGNTGSTSGSFIRPIAMGHNLATIVAIFTDDHGVPLTFDMTTLDLAGLNLILTDLNSLHVVNDTLTGNR